MGEGAVRGVVFKARGAQPWRFRLVANNNEPVASSEGYVDRDSAEDTIRLILGPDAVIEYEDSEESEAERLLREAEERANQAPFPDREGRTDVAETEPGQEPEEAEEAEESEEAEDDGDEGSEGAESAED